MPTQSDLLALQNSVRQTRKDILDLMDVAYANTPQWKLIRARIMSAFGREGLEGQVEQLLKTERPGAGDAKSNNKLA